MKRKKPVRSKQKPTPTHTPIKPEEAVEFLEQMRKLQEDVDEPTILISLRVPANLLRLLKLRAKLHQQKYQSLIIHFIRKGLKDKNIS